MFDLPGPDKLALQLNLPVLEAEDRLRAGCGDDEVYDLVLLATGDEEAAAQALADRIAHRLRKNQPVG